MFWRIYLIKDERHVRVVDDTSSLQENLGFVLAWEEKIPLCFGSKRVRVGVHEDLIGICKLRESAS